MSPRFFARWHRSEVVNNCLQTNVLCLQRQVIINCKPLIGKDIRNFEKVQNNAEVYNDI